MDKQKENSGFNWGNGITVVIITFIIATLSVVGYLVSLDYEMVTENHYQKAVNYQEHIDRVEKASMLENPVDISYRENNREIEIKFPKSLKFNNLEGKITLYRPNNSSLDRQLDLSLNKNGMQYISASDLQAGKWSVKINWSNGGDNFFSEQQLFL